MNKAGSHFYKIFAAKIKINFRFPKEKFEQATFLKAPSQNLLETKLGTSKEANSDQTLRTTASVGILDLDRNSSWLTDPKLTPCRPRIKTCYKDNLLRFRVMDQILH